MNTNKIDLIKAEVERLKRWNDNVRESTRHMTLQEEDFNRGKHSSYLEILNFIDSMQEEPVSDGLGEIVLDGTNFNKSWYAHPELAFKAGAEWQKEQINEALLSEVLPCFMNGGEADEVVAKLDEVLNQK